jgi:hypothetical protein
MFCNLYDWSIDCKAVQASGNGGPEHAIEAAIRGVLPGAWFEFEDPKAEADPLGFGAGKRGDVLIYKSKIAAAQDAAPVGRITFRETVES